MYAWVSTLHRWLKICNFSVIILKFVIIAFMDGDVELKTKHEKTMATHTLLKFGYTIRVWLDKQSTELWTSMVLWYLIIEKRGC